MGTMDRQEIMTKAAAWMHGRGWKQNLSLPRGRLAKIKN